MKRNLSANITLLVLSVSIFFLFFEGIQRLRYRHRYDSLYWLAYGFVPKPEKTDYYRMQLTGLYGIRGGGIVKIPRSFYDGYSKFNPDYPHQEYKVNSLGFRNHEFIPEKPAGMYRIAVIGDSTVFGLGVDDDSTFPFFLQANFDRFYPDRKIEVLNLGIPSFTTENMKNMIRGEVLGYAPDMIIVYGFFNDIYYSDAVFKKDRYLLTLLNAFLLDHSVFYLSLREKICKVLKKDIGMLHRGSLDTLVANLGRDGSIRNRLMDNLDDMADMAKNRNIKFVIAEQAVYLTDINIRDNGMLESDRLKPFYETIYSAIDEAGKRNSVKVVAVNKIMGMLTDEEKNRLFTDGVHLTPEGNRLIASAIFRDIKGYIDGKK